MWQDLFLILVIFSGVLIIYHHILYPVLLKKLAKKHSREPIRPIFCREYQDSQLDAQLPDITIVIPAYNEARVIADKIRNIAILDYPEKKVRVIIYCDGCTDNTVEIIEATRKEIECSHLNVVVMTDTENRGKVFAINHVMQAVMSEIVMLSDASALISIDGLLIAASYFNNRRVGVVCGTYHILNSQSSSEKQYWQYQTQIKYHESLLGAPLGGHGACYFFRTGLFSPLPADTINDDFVLPLEIVAKGYQAIYEPTILALELEPTTLAVEPHRRARIAAGNLQQLIRLRRLLKPRFGGVSFTFASGKALRVLMPLCLLVFFIGSFFLAFSSWVFLGLFSLQCVVYGLAIFQQYCPNRLQFRYVDTVHYFVFGYLATLWGMIGYVSGAYKQHWRPAKQSAMKHYSHIHPVVKWGKRFIDIIFSLIGLALTAVLLPFIALAIKVDSPGPVFFTQIRVGRLWPDHTELFMIVKFRTMKVDAESSGQAVWAEKDDPRITRVGRFLRKTRLDEFLQFVNVLKGDMSLIGPRPERPYFFSKLEKNIPFYIDRLYGVAPGITGLAQVNLGYGGSIEEVRNKLAYDHAYALVLSKPWIWFVTDFHILLQTIKVVILGRGQ